MAVNPSHVGQLDPTMCAECRSRSADDVYRFRAHRVWRCRECGVLYNPDFPPGESISDTFDQDYYLDHHEAAFRDQLEDHLADPSLPAFERGLDVLEELCPERGRILDIGCAFGTFLRLADRRGWKPSGVEISEFASNHARTVGGFEVFNGDLVDAPLAEGSFDAITFWDVIEHVYWPRDQIERALHLLRPGGALLVTTDNFDCLLSDTGELLRKGSLGRFLWPLERLYIPFNRTYFTADSLVASLQHQGFEVQRVSKMEYPLSKIKVSALQRIVLGVFYGLAALFKRQAQVTVVARKAG